MLFSNWIISDRTPPAIKVGDTPVGICLDIQQINIPFTDLLYDLQRDLNIPLSVLITDKVAAIASEDIETYLDNLLSIFYQPGFYIKNESPVIFLDAANSQTADFINALEKECVAQGYKKLHTIRLVPVSEQAEGNIPPVAYKIDHGDLDFKNITEKWIDNCLEKHNSWPITLLMADKLGAQTLELMLQKQNAFMNEKQYKIGNALYEIIEKAEAYQFQLHLKGINEHNNQAYLEFQKQDLAKILDFYKYEYEILPLWYKRFGHILKVISGKRTLKSLFSDDVKKYNKS
jgi:hypothetical protein